MIDRIEKKIFDKQTTGDGQTFNTFSLCSTRLEVYAVFRWMTWQKRVIKVRKSLMFPISDCRPAAPIERTGTTTNLVGHWRYYHAIITPTGMLALTAHHIGGELLYIATADIPCHDLRTGRAAQHTKKNIARIIFLGRFPTTPATGERDR